MPTYRGPEEGGYYRAKFVRVERLIVVTKPNDLQTAHSVLAAREGVYEEMRRLKHENPSEVDAGQIVVVRDPIEFGGNQINVHGDSSSTRTPVVTEAREKTIVDFAQQSEGFKINSEKFDTYPFT